jgi:hypothetical protein
MARPRLHPRATCSPAPRQPGDLAHGYDPAQEPSHALASLPPVRQGEPRPRLPDSTTAARCSRKRHAPRSERQWPGLCLAAATITATPAGDPVSGVTVTPLCQGLTVVTLTPVLSSLRRGRCAHRAEPRTPPGSLPSNPCSRHSTPTLIPISAMWVTTAQQRTQASVSHPRSPTAKPARAAVLLEGRLAQNQPTLSLSPFLQMFPPSFKNSYQIHPSSENYETSFIIFLKS